MGDVGEGPFVPAVGDVQEMSQYIPSSAVSRDTMATGVGSAAQPGVPRPGPRAAASARRARSVTRPVRWPQPSTSSTAVRRAAPPEAMRIWSSAAPPAGLAGAPAAKGTANAASMPVR